MKQIVLFFIVPILTASTWVSVSGQESSNLSGKYNYAIIETPYGDYFGHFTLRKNRKSYEGELVNEEGIVSPMHSVKVSGNEVTFKADFEDTRGSLFTFSINEDSVHGRIDVKGEDFNFILKGKKISD